jgi:hypothetical protein
MNIRRHRRHRPSAKRKHQQLKLLEASASITALLLLLLLLEEGPAVLVQQRVVELVELERDEWGEIMERGAVLGAIAISDIHMPTTLTKSQWKNRMIFSPPYHR